jgi:hypothetical protein
MLFSLSGAVILFSFPNLVTLFLGIEVLSIPLYVMAGSNKTDLRSSEAAIKYNGIESTSIPKNKVTKLGKLKSITAPDNENNIKAYNSD